MESVVEITNEPEVSLSEAQYPTPSDDLHRDTVREVLDTAEEPIRETPVAILVEHLSEIM